jgi:hypothetical protein
MTVILRFRFVLTRLPYVFPSLIMMPVLIIFKTSFVAVPAFILVLPVTTSGPVTGAMT